MGWPHITIYTDKLPAEVGGRAVGPLVRIRPKYEHDLGIHEHELEHVKQWWILTLLVGLALLIVLGALELPIHFAGFGVFAHALLRSASHQYRLWCEAVAYAKQTHFPDRDGNYLTLEQAADMLIAGDHYRLGLTRGAALAALQRLEPDLDME